MGTRAWTRRFVTGVVLFGGSLLLLSPGAAPVVLGQATPVAALPAVPRPEECQVAPRERYVVPREVPAPAASPVPVATPGADEPVDAATTEAIAATVREALACRNAGDLARAYALFSDELVLDILGSAETVPPEIVTALGQAPRRVPRESRLALVAIGPATTLADGRVLARVATRSADVDFIDDLVFREVNGRWVIDDAFAVVGER